MGSDSIDIDRFFVSFRFSIASPGFWRGPAVHLTLNLILETLIAEQPCLVGRLANLFQCVLGNSGLEQSPGSRDRFNY